MITYSKPSDVKIGVVGYGGAFNMGRHHFQEARQAGMTPTAVADLDPARLKVAEADFPGIQTFTDLKDLLKKSDANLIVIITPHNVHSKLALQCLRAGRHVVVEKPIAVTTAECDRMIAAAEKSGVMLSTYHNRHWDGCIMQAVKTIVNKGSIGDVVRIEAHMGGWQKPRPWWRSSRTISGGILYDWGVHLLEYALQLVDAQVVEVSGFATTGFWSDKTPWKDETNEDEATAVVRFDSGVHVTLRISSLEANPKPGMMEITGTKGSYVFDMGSYELVRPKSKSVVREKGTNPDRESWRYYQNVADHLTQGKDLVITPEWSRRPVHIIDCAVKSAKQGKAVKAKYG